MTHDHSSDHDDQAQVSHDDQGHDDHEHGDHGPTFEDIAAEKPTIVPVNWRQLIFPVMILVIVFILLIGPVTHAFAPQPAPPTTEKLVTTGKGTTTEVQPTTAPAATSTVTPVQPTPTTQSLASTATPLAPVAVAATEAPAISGQAIATRTAVAVAGEQGNVTRAPMQLDIAGTQFTVVAGGEVLPDWKTTAEEGKAVWITGTYANHVIYLPYSASNAAIFASVKSGDRVQLVMDTGQIFEFAVTRSERAFNGPPTTEGQFTTATAMNQDHAGVTLFLVGEATNDRAVVQADFTGNIQ
ncbi:MAG: hypothetical protein ABIQ44_02910 [Chloroflexia bacterium]